MAATYPHEILIPESVSVFCSALNARKTMEPPLPTDVVASTLCFHTSQLSIKALLEAKLADVALVVRRATEKADADYIDSPIKIIDG